jgi:hypothetical protein
MLPAQIVAQRVIKEVALWMKNLLLDTSSGLGLGLESFGFVFFF